MNIKFHTNTGKAIFYFINAVGAGLIVYSIIDFKSISPIFLTIAVLYLLANLFPVKVYKESTFVWTSVIIIFAVFHLSFSQMVLLSLLAAVDPVTLKKKYWYKSISTVSILAICFAASKFVYFYAKADASLFKNFLANVPLIFALTFTVVVLYFFFVSVMFYFVDGSDISLIKKYVKQNILFEFALVPIGILLAIVYRFEPYALILLAFPLFAIYVTSGIRLKLMENKKVAARDKLTGLFNKQLLEEQLSIEVAQTAREKNHLSLLLVDLDNFKRFNETFGRPEGDITLKRVAQILGSAARESDICCRYAGEKFAIILPGTPTQGAAYVANRIRRFIELEGIGKPLMTVTASIGISSYPSDCENKEELFEIASSNLYIAKNKGKNRVQYLLKEATS